MISFRRILGTSKYSIELHTESLHMHEEVSENFKSFDKILQEIDKIKENVRRQKKNSNRLQDARQKSGKDFPRLYNLIRTEILLK